MNTLGLVARDLMSDGILATKMDEIRRNKGMDQTANHSLWSSQHKKGCDKHKDCFFETQETKKKL